MTFENIMIKKVSLITHLKETRTLVHHPIRNGMAERFKAAYSVTMTFFENFSFLFKSFVKVELSYVFTIKMFSTAENCIEK